MRDRSETINHAPRTDWADYAISPRNASGAQAAVCNAASPGDYFSFDLQHQLNGEYPPSVFPKGKQKKDAGWGFVSADNACRFDATIGDNQLGATASDFERLSEEYYRDKGASVTFHQSEGRWYVVSGITHGDIYYEKGVVSRDGSKIAVLLIQYPPGAKQDFDPIVKRMSHSFWIVG